MNNREIKKEALEIANKNGIDLRKKDLEDLNFCINLVHRYYLGQHNEVFYILQTKLTEIELKKRKRTKKANFLNCKRWKEIRTKMVKGSGNKCSECGKKLKKADAQLDHILPKSKFPELVYVETNLRIICWPCNKEKSNKITMLL